MSRNTSGSRLSLSVRLGLTSAIAVLLTAGCLTPLVAGYRWALDVLAVVVAVTLTGLIGRELTRWRPPVVIGQVLALLIGLTVIFARDHAIAGVLPSGAAWQHLRLLLDQGVEVTREQAPPVDSDPGVLLLLTLGIGVVAVAADAIAATWRRPALAGLPLLAVYCVPAAILVDGLSAKWFLLAACGFLLLVAADSSDRVRAWGRMVNAGSSTSAEGMRFGILPGSSGVRAGVAAILAALIVPLALPALGDPLIDGTGLGDGRGSGRGSGKYVNPILDLRRDLVQRSNDVALRMRTDDPTRKAPLLRMAVVDNFDGTTWKPRTDLPPDWQRVDRGLPDPPGLDSSIPAVKRRVEIRVGSLDQNTLPLPYPTTKVDVEGDWRYDAATLDVVGRGVRTAGLTYTADYLDVGLTAQRLLDGGAQSTVAMQPFLKLPDVPEALIRIAEEKAGNGTDFEKARNLQNWLRGPEFKYTTDAPGNGRDDAGIGVMMQFLEKKSGYCVHFASAMAVMARVLKIPSRVAVGFLPPEPEADGEYVVRFERAHAWPELYFAGSGWVQFEPTPATQAGNVPPWTVPPVGARPSPAVPVNPTQAPEDTGTAAPQGGDSGKAKTGAQHRSGAPSVPLWFLALLPLPALVLLPRGLAVLRRRRRWGRATSDPALSETAWQDLRLLLADLGSSWPASATPRQVRHLLVDRHDLTVREEAPLGRLVDDLETARYARPEDRHGGRQAAQRRQDVDLVRRAIADRAERSQRLKATWLPGRGATPGGPAEGGSQPAPAASRDVDSGHVTAQAGPR